MLKDAKKHQKRPEPRVAAKTDDRWKAPRNEKIIENMCCKEERIFETIIRSLPRDGVNTF